MSASPRALRSSSSRRGNLWLAALAVVQAGLLVLVLLTVARPPAASSGPLLGKGVTTADVTAFTVTSHDGTTISLKRDGVNWVLPAQAGFPAQSSRVKSFLQELTALQKTGLVATTKDAYKRLQVAADDYQRKIVLTLKGGKSETLLIGSEPSYGSTHVRLASDKGVYVTHSLHAGDARTDAAGYVDSTFVKLDPTRVTRMEVKNANGDFVFTRSGTTWSLQGLPSGKQLDTGAVSSLLGSLTDIQLDEPLGKKVEPAYGLNKPLAVLTLTTVTPVKTSSSTGPASTASTGASTSGAASTGGSSSASKASATSSTAASSSAAAATTSSPSPSSASSTAATKTAAAPAAKTVTKTTTITVGAKDKAGFYPIQVSDSPFIVRVSGASLGGAIAKKQADFIAKPPASSSGSAPSGSNAGGVSGLTGGLPGTSGAGGSTGH